MKAMTGAVLTGKNRLELSDEPCATGAFVRPLIKAVVYNDDERR